jgi:hypothetical protein
MKLKFKLNLISLLAPLSQTTMNSFAPPPETYSIPFSVMKV